MAFKIWNQHREGHITAATLFNGLKVVIAFWNINEIRYNEQLGTQYLLYLHIIHTQYLLYNYYNLLYYGYYSCSYLAHTNGLFYETTELSSATTSYNRI